MRAVSEDRGEKRDSSKSVRRGFVGALGSEEDARVERTESREEGLGEEGRERAGDSRESL